MEIELEISSLKEEQQKIVRRLEQLQKTVDLLFADRSILEDLQGSIAHLKQIVLANQTHQDTMQIDTKANIEEVKNIISDKTVIVKHKENIFEKIKDKLTN